ncbi:hypothetical protein NHQ30_005563 [Ciborinia camelliae]|nr:hypothetical protein NHQ30_005563 [Ciborinia camelliae]
MYTLKSDKTYARGEEAGVNAKRPKKSISKPPKASFEIKTMELEKEHHQFRDIAESILARDHE